MERKAQPFLIQLFDLTLVQLSNWRWSWRSLLIASTVTPILSMVALGVFAGSSDPQTLGYILVGNLVLALMFGTLNKVSNNFAFMRARGMLQFFAALPIQSSSLVLATVIAFFLLALPSVFVTLAFGVFYFRLPVHLSPLLPLVLLLASAALSGLGAIIGARARDPEEANAISLLTTLVLMGIGPVIVPPEQLPPALRILGLFSPATYAASALRQVLLGPQTPRLALDLAALSLFALLALGWVERRLSWRQSDT